MNPLDEFKQSFDPYFEDFVWKQISKHFSLTITAQKIGEHLLKLSRGGKRIRPYIAMLAFQDGGTSSEGIRRASMALELFHLFALIHDDIIDDGDTRHRVACLHRVFGEKQALLAGDMVLSWAYEIMNGCEHEDARGVFSALANETIEGQMLDVALSEGEELTLEHLNEVVERKTVRYTFIYPAFIGQVLAGTGERAIEYVPLARHLGTAFQRLDDLADVFWDEKDLGKKPGADIAAGVPTHLYYYVLQSNDREAVEAIRQAFGSKKEVDAKELAIYITRCGALEREVREIAEQLMGARAALARMTLEPDIKKQWQNCITLLTEKLHTF